MPLVRCCYPGGLGGPQPIQTNQLKRRIHASRLRLFVTFSALFRQLVSPDLVRVRSFVVWRDFASIQGSNWNAGPGGIARTGVLSGRR